MLFKYRPRPIHIGADIDDGEDVFLEPALLETHVHILGPPGVGKTRLLLGIAKQLFKRPDATTIIINPKGDLIRMARDAAVNAGQGSRLILFDPADSDHIIGYNPLRPNGLSIANHAKAAREGICSAWGQDSFDKTPQLARFLFVALCAVRELEMTLVEAVQLLRAGSIIRSQVLARLQNPFVREALEYLDSLREARQEELVASTLARLEAFVMDDTIRPIITQQAHALDLGEVIENSEILLVNLEQFKPLRPDDVKLLGRLIINDIVAHVFSRSGARRPVFLLIDECHTFATQDLCLSLDQGRELGLHCILAHQFLGQLLREDPSGLLLGSVTESARTKIVFGGMSTRNLEEVAKELFLGDFDPLEVKDEIETLELEPVESTRRVPTVGYSESEESSTTRTTGRSQTSLHGESDTTGESHSYGSSTSQSTGTIVQDSDGEIIVLTPEGDDLQVGHQEGSSMATVESTVETSMESHTRSRSHSVQRATTRGTSEQEGTTKGRGTSRSRTVALTPFYEYLKRYRVSSRTFWTFEEFIVRSMQRLQRQSKAHFVLKKPAASPIFVCAADVRTPFVPQRLLAPALQRICSRPIYATPLQIEHEEAQRRRALVRIPDGRTIEVKPHAGKLISYKRNKGSSEA